VSAFKSWLLAGLLAAGMTGGGSAQVAPPAMAVVDPVKADFMAKTGSDVVYFAGTGHFLDAAARTTLTAQAQWLLANPAIQVRIEGHSDLADTRDHALGIGMRRANSVRDFLLLNGVPAAQVTAVSFGKERPATNGPGEAMAALNRRAVTVLVR
jgi:peptidoglycan-associated lipoprotein